MVSNKKHILILLEGASREVQIIKSLKKNFFNDVEFNIVHLSMNNNLFVLFNKLKKDQFETDIIELLKEDTTINTDSIQTLERDQITEIYLFFDYEIHNQNLAFGVDVEEVLKEMMNIFNEETEMGKLYISYPMVEALRDIGDECESYSCRCYLEEEKISEYKKLSANKLYTQLSKYTLETWRIAINHFIKRVGCFLSKDLKNIQSYKDNDIKNEDILLKELKIWATDRKVFILSAFPKFIVDYFRTDILESKFFYKEDD